ncbi:MAG: prephenate dehydrogenase [Candidatus Omnitrophota bacterium]
MVFKKVAIFGVGLIGGSIGAGLKTRKMAQEVVGVGRRLESLKKAAAVDAIDSYTVNPGEGLVGADLIILAAPINAVLELLKSGLPFLGSRRCLITDACSTKAAVLKVAGDALPGNFSFVGGHPIAGSEQNGPEAADPNLFENRVTVLTPTSKTGPSDLKKVQLFWEGLGSRVFLLSPEEHDRILATTSHIPHLLAVLAALTVKRLAVAKPERFLGTGFRDVTRIAAGEPSVWQDVFLTNREYLLQNLSVLEKMLAEWKSALQAGDREYVLKALDEAKEFQKSLM